MERGRILQMGKVELRVWVAGMMQRHVFTIEREQTPSGKIPFLSCKRQLPLNELVRLAEENGLPVRCGGQKIFPKGKSPKDFAGL